MKRTALVFVGLALMLVLPGLAAALEVEEAVITTQVVDRVPVDEVETISANVGTLTCFTRIAGAEGDTTVAHVWYWGEREMARVELAVRAATWRTWSTKTILPEWTGGWRVDIVDADGNLLKTLPFTLN